MNNFKCKLYMLLAFNFYENEKNISKKNKTDNILGPFLIFFTSNYKILIFNYRLFSNRKNIFTFI